MPSCTGRSACWRRLPARTVDRGGLREDRTPRRRPLRRDDGRAPDTVSRMRVARGSHRAPAEPSSPEARRRQREGHRRWTAHAPGEAGATRPTPRGTGRVGGSLPRTSDLEQALRLRAAGTSRVHASCGRAPAATAALPHGARRRGPRGHRGRDLAPGGPRPPRLPRRCRGVPRLAVHRRPPPGDRPARAGGPVRCDCRATYARPAPSAERGERRRSSGDDRGRSGWSRACRPSRPRW